MKSNNNYNNKKRNTYYNQFFFTKLNKSDNIINYENKKNEINIYFSIKKGRRRNNYENNYENLHES